jgi:hypothetical protein
LLASHLFIRLNSEAFKYASWGLGLNSTQYKEVPRVV